MTRVLTIRGERKLRRNLQKLGAGAGRRAVRTALRKPAGRVSRELKKAVPAQRAVEAFLEARPDFGIRVNRQRQARSVRRDLKKSIGRRKRTYKHSGVVLEAIGVRYNYRVPAADRKPAGVIVEALESDAGGLDRTAARERLMRSHFGASSPSRKARRRPPSTGKFLAKRWAELEKTIAAELKTELRRSLKAELRKLRGAS